MILEQTLHDAIGRLQEIYGVVPKSLPRALADRKPVPGFVQVITGVRRCGKSTAMLQMRTKRGAARSVFMNFESPLLDGFAVGDFTRLDHVLRDLKCERLFLDEVQALPRWEILVRQLLDLGLQVTVSGSNASLLGRELGTKLTGRHLSDELFPFSYGEFLAYTRRAASDVSLRDYLNRGGFPEYLRSGEETVLASLFNDILFRDIASRHGVRETARLRSLALWLAANIGGRVSAGKLAQPLKIDSSSTILQWFSHLEDAYLFFFVPKFSHSARATLVNPRKVYCVDTGLRQALVVSCQPDEGRLFENLVFLKLRRRHSSIFYFDEGHECDFVVLERDAPKRLVQASWELNDLNLDREKEGLRLAMSFFGLKEGEIVTFHQADEIKVPEGRIHVVPFAAMAD